VNAANVQIIDEDDVQVNLSGEGNGSYSASYAFRLDRRYKVRIQINGKTYESELTEMMSNVPIDSVTYAAGSESLVARVYAHDDSETERYFRYSYDATHEYRSSFTSLYTFSGGIPQYRSPEEEISSCWLTFPSTSVLLATSEGLGQNVVAGLQLIELPKGDSKLWFRYSLLVRQYALDKKAYDYWSQLKKVSESLGGLFDPIPFSVTGNVRSLTDPEEKVLGYFSGGEVTSKRIVIRNADLPLGYFVSSFGDCVEGYVRIQDLSDIANLNVLLTRADYLGIFILGYYYTSPDCADCRFGGGTSVRPPFM